MTAFPSYEPMQTTRGCSRESASATAVTGATFTCSRRARFWIGPRLSLAGHVSFCHLRGLPRPHVVPLPGGGVGVEHHAKRPRVA